MRPCPIVRYDIVTPAYKFVYLTKITWTDYMNISIETEVWTTTRQRRATLGQVHLRRAQECRAAGQRTVKGKPLNGIKFGGGGDSSSTSSSSSSL